jgi:hypothetical protein
MPFAIRVSKDEGAHPSPHSLDCVDVQIDLHIDIDANRANAHDMKPRFAEAKLPMFGSTSGMSVSLTPNQRASVAAN